MSKKRANIGLTVYVFHDETPFNEYIAINITCGYTDQVKIASVPGESKPVFSGSAGIFGGRDAVFHISSNYITLSNLIIENVFAHETLQGIWIRGDNNTIFNCELRHLYRSGIVVQGDYNLIEKNTIWDITGINGKKGNNISIEGYPNGITSDNNTIIGNELYTNPTHVGNKYFSQHR